MSDPLDTRRNILHRAGALQREIGRPNTRRSTPMPDFIQIGSYLIATDKITDIEIRNPAGEQPQAFIHLTSGRHFSLWGRDAELFIAWAMRHTETITE